MPKSSSSPIIDYYSILDVSPSSSFRDILSAYQKSALKAHPDLHPDNRILQKRFQEVSEAYYVLSDPQRKKEYDEARKKNGSGGSSSGGGNRTMTLANNNPLNWTEFLGIHVHPDEIFGNVFDELLSTEMRSMEIEGNAGNRGGTSVWGFLGSASGAVLGFIVANVPGSAVGGYLGFKLGKVRDTTGKSVLEVWTKLTREQKYAILQRLAVKLL
ncbi:DnaJ domain-containing protein [Paraphysoderma sedebokerense]|nr:DnaJ domain-containing protein [Paraphysoderma sedebokerense]